MNEAEKSPIFIVVRGGVVDLVGTSDPDLLDRIRTVVIDMDVEGVGVDHELMRHVQVGDPDDDLSWDADAIIDRPQFLYLDVTIGK